MRQFLIAATALALGGCASLGLTPSGPGGVDPAPITAALKGFTDSGQLVGASALVTRDNKEVYFGAFGYADREAGRPMARNTIVRIFSMTKPVTGVALMQLWEAGKFRLDDPVEKYLPEFAGLKVFDHLDAAGKPVLVAPERPVTIRDLTRHTAGLTYCGGDNLPALQAGCDAADIRTPAITLDEFGKRLGALPIEFQPGRDWRYSFAVDVQALLVQRLSGQAFDHYIQEHILDPLQMKDTGFFVPEDKRNRFAAVYDRHEDGSFTPQTADQAYGFNTKHWPLMPGGYGLTSTLDDYTRFARMLLNGGELDGVRLLKPSTVQTMTANQLDPAVTERIWLPSKGRVGFGIDVAVRTDPPASKDEAAGEVGEFFWDGAAYTLFWVDPKNRLTAVFFTQYQPFGKVPAHKALRDAIYRSVDPSALPPQQ